MDTSELIKTIKEVLDGCPDLKILRDMLADLQTECAIKHTHKFIEIDRLLYKIFGDKWINS